MSLSVNGWCLIIHALLRLNWRNLSWAEQIDIAIRTNEDSHKMCAIRMDILFSIRNVSLTKCAEVIDTAKRVTQYL